MGNDKDEYEGMTRLPTQDDDDTPDMIASPMDRSDRSQPPRLPQARQRTDGLRGRTLCLFTASNPIRLALDRLLRFPFVQSGVLLTAG